MSQEPDVTGDRCFDPMVPLLALALSDDAFTSVTSVNQIYVASPRVIRQHGNSLPLENKATMMATLLLRDFEVDGSTCEEKGWTYFSSLRILANIARKAGFFVLPTPYSIRRQGMGTVNAHGVHEADLRQMAGHNAGSWTFVANYLSRTSRVDIQAMIQERTSDGHTLDSHNGWRGIRTSHQTFSGWNEKNERKPSERLGEESEKAAVEAEWPELRSVSASIRPVVHAPATGNTANTINQVARDAIIAALTPTAAVPQDGRPGTPARAAFDRYALSDPATVLPAEHSTHYVYADPCGWAFGGWISRTRLVTTDVKRSWEAVLHTNKKIIKKKYSGLDFAHSIYTDGVAVSISMQAACLLLRLKDETCCT
ncbi:hypothetical protein HKX48_007820 [Thoreauomyces humboldtii]|nr:hypothetical protein HKX48_007820 [Thoreauomyces humboldtii]